MVPPTLTKLNSSPYLAILHKYPTTTVVDPSNIVMPTFWAKMMDPAKASSPTVKITPLETSPI